MIIPPYLKKGDRIGIVAPARKVSSEEMAFAFDQIKSWGFEPVPAPHLYHQSNQFSGTDEQRAEDMNFFLGDHSIRAVIAARGGYGCLRIVDDIAWDLLLDDPKWICGYSDVTVFHNHLLAWGMASVHGTMPINFHKNEEATRSLHDLLTGMVPEYSTPIHKFNVPGNAHGMLIGGNLSLMYAMIGSTSFPPVDGCILFLEDLDEYLYHIDRMMISLKRAGVLSRLSGIMVGGMSDMKDNTIPFGKAAEEIIYDSVKEYNYPVCFDFPAGHIDRNLALMIGAEVSFSVGAGGAKLRYASSF